MIHTASTVKKNPFNVLLPFISLFSLRKQKREIKGAGAENGGRKNAGPNDE